MPWTVPGSDLCSVMLGQGGTTLAHGRRLPAGRRRLADSRRRSVRRGGPRGRRQLRLPALRRHRLGVDARRRQVHAAFTCPTASSTAASPGRPSAPYLTVYLGAEDNGAAGRPDGAARRRGRPAGRRSVAVVGHAQGRGAGRDRRLLRDRRRQGGAALPHSRWPASRATACGCTCATWTWSRAPRSRSAVRGRGRGRQRRPRRRGDGERVRPHGRQPCRARRRRRSPRPAPLPTLGDAEVAVIDELDKVQPVTGEMIPKQADGYLAANHLWSAKTKAGPPARRPQRVRRLPGPAARRGEGRAADADLRRRRRQGRRSTFGRYHHMPDTKKGPLPDPIVPLGDGLDVPRPTSGRAEVRQPATSRSTSRTTRRPATTRASSR